jgi:bacterioferritin (cytochrome b1)
MSEKKELAEILSEIEEKADDLSKEINLFLNQFGLEISSEEHSSLTSALKLIDLAKYYIKKAKTSMENA